MQSYGSNSEESSSYNKEGLLTAHEVSELLRIPLSTVYYLTQQKQLKCVRIGKHIRYRQEDIQSHINPAESAQSFPENIKASQNLFEANQRQLPRLNTHIACQFTVVIPGWKTIRGKAAIRKMSEAGVYLRKVNCECEGGELEQDDPVILQFDLLGEVQGRVMRVDQNPTQGGQNGPVGMFIEFRQLSKEAKKKIQGFLG